MSKLQHYWKELQRRHVVKAGLAYLVMAWLILQVLSILFPAFEASDGLMRIAIIILLIGFPIWLILAWVYDFSWGSIQKTEDVPFDAEVSRKKNVGLNRLIIGGLAIAVILLLVNTARLSGKVDSMEDEFLAMNFTNSLAILPFKDLSPKQDQRYFSDGLARSIYDRLARSKDLKLISPTSSFQYRDKDVSIEVIADELGVRYVLEGSVQLFEDQYRASINLVDTRDGSTIWSKTFRDQIADILGTYDEVSENVGNYLKVTLTSEDVRGRKVDPEAYLLYLKAEDTLPYHSEVSTLAADSLIRRSIQIDPTYAPSQATLSMTTLHKGLYVGLYSRDEAIRMGIAAAKTSIAIDPQYTGGHIWLSNWQWHNRNLQGSLENMNRAIEIGPIAADQYGYLVHQYFRTNQIEKASKALNKGLELDPRNRDLYMWRLNSNDTFDNLENAVNNLDKFYEFDKSKIGYYGYLAYYLSHFGEYEKAVEALNNEEDEQWALFIKGFLYQKVGREQEAMEAVEKFKKIGPEEYSDGVNFYTDLAGLYALRGEKDKAFQVLNEHMDEVIIILENLFTYKEFNYLHDDPRWDAYMERLGEEFNYDFTHGS